MNHNREETVFSYSHQENVKQGSETEFGHKQNHGGTESQQTSPARKWLARLGVAGFMFFFLKGMVWLAVIFGVGKCVL